MKMCSGLSETKVLASPFNFIQEIVKVFSDISFWLPVCRL